MIYIQQFRRSASLDVLWGRITKSLRPPMEKSVSAASFGALIIRLSNILIFCEKHVIPPSHQRENFQWIDQYKKVGNSFPSCMPSVLRSICSCSPESQEIDRKVTPSTRPWLHIDLLMANDQIQIALNWLGSFVVSTKLSFRIRQWVRAQRGILIRISPHP